MTSKLRLLGFFGGHLESRRRYLVTSEEGLTLKPRSNDLRYNDIPGITINNPLPTKHKLQ